MTLPQHQFPNALEADGPPVVRVQSLGSGSSGNAFLIEHGESGLLLDCGVGIRTIQRAMRDRRRAMADLDAVLVTHEHIDHIRTLPQVLGLDIPVIASKGTFDRTRIADRQWMPITSTKGVEIGGASVWSLPVRHDAAEPCGFLVELAGVTITVLTDLGSWRDELSEPLLASDLIVLEANHDLEMLRLGPYPPHLKRRVGSATGHLSNEDCGTVLADLARRGSRAPDVWLAHMSDTNNRPELAKATVDAALLRIDRELPVTPLPRRTPGQIWTSAATRKSKSRWGRPPASAATQLSIDGI